MAYRVDQLDLIEACYFMSSFLFVMALGGLSNQESSKRGNFYGIGGMTLAIVVTFFTEGFMDYDFARFAAAIVIGATIGILISATVEMINMPQLVAALHSFVGVAATIVGFANFGRENGFIQSKQTYHGIEYSVAGPQNLVETYIGVFIGAVTLSGSVVACGKLNGNIKSEPLILGGEFRHVLNLLVIIACIALGAMFVWKESIIYLGINCALALFLGWHLVMAIGGADMPVVVSMLNSYSGWATSASGFMLDNICLIISGALIGSSGAILSYIMCRAMNRSFFNVIAGGFGIEIEKNQAVPTGEIKEIKEEKVLDSMLEAKEIIIVPGYGMAVAKAQHAIGDLVKELRKMGKKCRFAIHAVAGRLPGHMNVLLAEANVPYDIVVESDHLNEDGSFDRADVVLILGANDIVNPDALENPKSPIAGMPVCQVWRSKKVFVVKRGAGKGYAAIENPLFFKENTWMYYGGAKEQMEKLIKLLHNKMGSGVQVQQKAVEQKEEQVQIEVEEDMSKYKHHQVHTIGVPKEVMELESRVSLVPSTVKYLVKKKFKVVVETGAGEPSGYTDEAYEKAGAEIASCQDVWSQSEIIVKIRAPQYNPNLGKNESESMENCKLLISYIGARLNPNILDQILVNKDDIDIMALEETPRTTKAQKLDTISSVNNLIGYKGTLEAYSHLPRFSKGSTTAAGKINPSKVFIIGAGVAGLAAIGVARGMGAIVKAFDTRAACKEQIESLGGEFVSMDYEEKGEGAGGYGKEMSKEYYEAQDNMVQKQAKEVDIIITTALIPGKPAPKLISEKAVRNMKPGSVIVDCAAENGGNCVLTKRGEVVVTENKVTILGYYDYPSRMAQQASDLFSINMKNLLDELIGVPMAKENTAEHWKIDPNDEIQSFQSGLLVVHKGQKTTRFGKPPQQQAQPQQQQQQQIQSQKAPEQKPNQVAPGDVKLQVQPEQKKPAVVNLYAQGPMIKSDFLYALVIFLILLAFWLVVGIFTQSSYFINQLGIFVLAIFTGYLVIWNVKPALHTPLMSETNAISGIIVAGCMVTLRSGTYITDGGVLTKLQNPTPSQNFTFYNNPNIIDITYKTWGDKSTPVTSVILKTQGDYVFVGYTVCAFIGLLFASINVFGGFLITHRMLKMFRRT